MSVVGKADTAPITDGDEAENRSRSRRVDISINQGKPLIFDPISVLE
jgi:chemotaxis protein MotB